MILLIEATLGHQNHLLLAFHPKFGHAITVLLDTLRNSGHLFRRKPFHKLSKPIQRMVKVIDFLIARRYFFHLTLLWAIPVWTILSFLGLFKTQYLPPFLSP